MPRIQRHRIGTAVQLGGVDPAQLDAAAADAVAASPAILGMPTVATQNYTRHLSRYASLTAALADLPNGGADGGEIRIDSEIDVTGTWALPANIHLIGRGAGTTALRGASGINAPILALDGASGTVVADLSILPPVDDTAGTSARGLLVAGDSGDVTVERVTASGFHMNVQVDGSAGTTPGTIRNLALTSVRADDGTGSYGILIADANGVTLDHCTANRNWLDGLKLQAQTFNVTDVGGIYNDNGQSYVNGGGSIGDGIDAYAGGMTCAFIGTVADGNHGNGIYLKTDSLTRDDPSGYGYPRNAQVVNVRCRNNTVGSGLVVVRWPIADDTVPYIAHTLVQGGVFEGNKLYGLHLNGLNTGVSSPLCLNNGRHGILVETNALYTRISDPRVIGNSRDSAGTYDGIYISAGSNHTEIDGYTILGVDAENVTEEADLATLTKYHRHNIYAHTGALDVRIGTGFQAYSAHAGTIGIVTNQTSGVSLIDYREDRNPASPGAYGSVGSTFINTTASNRYDVAWIRRWGTPNQHNVGWQRISDPPIVTALPTAAATLKGTMLTLDNGGASADTLHLCVQTGASTYAWRQVTLV